MITNERRLPCFKPYDIRGRVPDELNEAIAYRVGQAFVELRRPQRLVVGHDMRLSSRELADAVVEGIVSKGVDVVDIGLCGTEMMYFATAHLEREGVDGGIMVTASHNPADYNGMKLVGRGAKPIHGENGLEEIESLVADGYLSAGPSPRGRVEKPFLMPDYVSHLMQYVDDRALDDLTIVANAGNGGAGLVVDALENAVRTNFVKVHHEPDGSFPNGVPNPLLPENRGATIEAVRSHEADMGIAWDGDFDRCFLFDEKGQFIEGYYIVGLLAEEMLRREPGAKIIYEPRLTWNTEEVVGQAGGRPVLSRTGHAFIKDRMRAEDAVYGGEMSAHHYFRDFAYCDSGMIPWLVVANIMKRTGKPLSELIGDRQARFPASGEINRKVDDIQKVLDRIRLQYLKEALFVDETDGLSLEFEDWRFNLRASNTEPVIRLNVESRGDVTLMKEKTEEVLEAIDHV
jgi:phosphomannomutase/phosphomannomutase/phosphoglucomutase